MNTPRTDALARRIAEGKEDDLLCELYEMERKLSAKSAECAGLEQERLALREERDHDAADISRLEAECRRLREALGPLVQLHDLEWHRNHPSVITAVEKARAALQEVTP